MTELNYEKTKEKIDSYYKDKIMLETKVEDDDEKKLILFNIFGNLNNDLEIKDLYIIELIGNIKIIKYKTVNNDLREEEVIVFIKNNHPIFKINHHEQSNNDTIYSDTTYSTYEENNNYLLNKIHIKTLINNNFSVSNISILNRIDPNVREYYTREYEFYKNNNETIAIKSQNKEYLKMNSNFENVLSIAEKLIDKVSIRIIDYLDNIIIEGQVKEYSIKRKVKK